ncbi:MAG: GTPase Era [Acholeplasmataceae bacterium]
MKTQKEMSHKFAFVGIAGKPNVGKSTLINALIGEKIAITSAKAQTTRHRILGVKNTPDYQLIFVDTPGLHQPKQELNRAIVKTAETALLDVDVILWVVDRMKSIYDETVYDKMKTIGVPIILVINKIDTLSDKMAINDMIISYLSLGEFDAVIPVSAKNKQHLTHLIDAVMPHTIESPKMFPEDYVSNQSDKQKMSEWIREKILYETEQEVPHSVAVIIESVEDNKKHKTLDVRALIIVERDSQKKILIGKQGQKLKEIGKRARLDLKKTLGQAVHLELWIKVKKDWRDRKQDVAQFGYGLDE